MLSFILMENLFSKKEILDLLANKFEKAHQYGRDTLEKRTNILDKDLVVVWFVVFEFKFLL